MKFSLVPAVFAAALVVHAAPIREAGEASKREFNMGGLPFGSVLGSGTPQDAAQGAVAKVFGLGDLALNGPASLIGRS
ncbi:hypothetical protein UVI_02000370 [Ustilaginoidea virens]|nr:hypothetical protein UVI_02000370 [Ustilaginoidea virens]